MDTYSDFGTMSTSDATTVKSDKCDNDGTFKNSLDESLLSKGTRDQSRDITSLKGDSRNSSDDAKHFYGSNIINGSREVMPIGSLNVSPLKSNDVDTNKYKRHSLELRLNKENEIKPSERGSDVNLKRANEENESEKKGNKFSEEKEHEKTKVNKSKPNKLKSKLNKEKLFGNSKDPKETDLLLGESNKHLIVSNGKKESPEEEKPVLHVQFDNERRDSSSTASCKDPCPSPSSSVSSNSSSSSSSSSSEESIEITEARPPDGGWGWVIVAASFVVNLIADGVAFSFGVIYVEFLNYFGENRSKTAWIGSLFLAMPLLSGPIASFLTDRYGCRKVTMIGSFLSCLGFVISSFTNSIEVLFLTFGVLSGFGLSLCYVASVVIVAYYFDKKRSLATGLSVCGSGIGTFIFAPLTQILLEEYGWRGTTLILAGLFLNLAVCGALMRDLPWTCSRQKTLAKERKRNRNLKRKRNGSSVDTFSVSNSTNTPSVLQPILEVNEKEKEENVADRLSSSLVNLPTFVRNGEKVPIEVIELLSTHKNVYNVLIHNYPNLLTPSRSFSDSGRLNEAHFINHQKLLPLPSPLGNAPPVLSSTGNQEEHKDDKMEDAYVWWLKRNQITPPRFHPQKKVPTAYLKDLRVHRLSLTYRGAMLNINR